MAKQLSPGERDQSKIVATIRQIVSENENSLKSANNLSDVADAGDSFDNIKQIATETYSGVAEFATADEAEAATAEDKIMSPARALDFMIANQVGDGGGNLQTRVTDIETRLAKIDESLADSLNTFLSVGNGWIDPYDDSAGIDTGASSGYTRSNGYVQPSTSGGSLITASAVITGPSAFSSATLINDGAINVASLLCANKSYNSGVLAYLALTFSSATAVDKIIVYGSNDQGFLSSVNPSVSFWAKGYTAAPTNTTFTSTGTYLTANPLGFFDTTNESAGRTLTNTLDRVTAFTHVGIIVQHYHTASATWRFAEVDAYSPLTVSAMDMKSISLAAAGTISQMAVKFWVELVDSVTVNTDFVCKLSTDGGTNWQTMTLVDQTTAPLPGGSSASTWRMYSCDFTAITGMASYLTPKVRLQSANNKIFKIHQTRLMWK